MSKTKTGVRGLRRRGKIWHIQKRISVGRRKSVLLHESTGTTELREAERYLARRTEQVREEYIFGVTPGMTLIAAATRYLNDNQQLRSIDRSAIALGHMIPELGHLKLDEIHDESINSYVVKRLAKVSASTVHKELSILRRILNLANRSWRGASGQPCLRTVPLLTMPTGGERKPYPITYEEQERLMAELPEHLQDCCLFMLNTGVRSGELANLRWEWERRIAETGLSIFVLPESFTKTSTARIVILNMIAQQVLDAQRGKHPVNVFTYDGSPMRRPGNSAWRKARKRAGLDEVRVHDLRHSYAARLRAAGVSNEDRQDLLGHSAGNMTTHYSAAEIGRLVVEAEKIVDSSPLLLARHSDWVGQKRGRALSANGAVTLQ